MKEDGDGREDDQPVLKQVLELGPPLRLLRGLYSGLRDETFMIGGTEYDGFIVGAAAFVPILLLSIAVLWWLSGKISRMQVFTAVLVIVFGGLTVWFNDETFFKMKTTIVYGIFAAILGIGLLQGRSYLAWVMSEFLPMRHEGWMILTRRLTACFAALAVGNEVVWRTMSTDAWVKIETFGFPHRAVPVPLGADHTRCRRYVGYHLADRVYGLDGMTDYYDVALKRRRHQMLLQHEGFTATEVLLEDAGTVMETVRAFRPDVIVHLAAQAGVRYSIENPAPTSTRTSPAPST
jgi:intracellular septation protein